MYNMKNVVSFLVSLIQPRKTARRVLTLALVSVAASTIAVGPKIAVAAWVPVSLPQTNYNLQAGYWPNLPTGNVTLQGVLFNIPAGGNCWASAGTGGGTLTYTILSNLYGVQEVDTLLNTSWGAPGPNSYVSVEFFGTGSAYYAQNLYGNSDIRDWHNDGYTNSLNGTTAINWYTENNAGNLYPRIDKQAFTLPAIFQTETLQRIVFTDTGADFLQRLIISGVSAKVAPEPSTWTTNTDGKWSTLGNWTSGVPNGSGTTANFTGATLAAVNVDGPVVVGRIFLDAGTPATNYTLSGSSITLDNTGGTGSSALIDAVSGNHTISSQVILAEDTTITGGGSLDLSGGITGNFKLTVLNNINATSIQVDTLVIGTHTTAVPEPSAIALLLTATLGGLLWWHRRA